MNPSLTRSLVLVSLLLVFALNSGKADVPGEHLTSRAVKVSEPVEPVAVGTEIETPDIRKRVALPDGSTLFVDRDSKVKVESDRQIILLSGQLFVETASKDNKSFVVETPVGKVSGNDATFAVRLDKGKLGLIVTRGQVSYKKLSAKAGQQLVPGSKEVTAAPRASHLLDWTRELLAEQSPLVPGSPYAGGALIAVDQNGQQAKLALRKYHVDVHIQDGFARTTIDQTYFNHDPAQLEGTFYFPLPPDASLSRLAMYVNGQLMEGGMAERDYARQVYETIRYANRDPALLEWVDGSTFKMRVFPIEGRQEKRIILSYTQKLDSLYGQTTYRFPAGHSLQVVKDWSFSAFVKNGAGLAWTCPSHHELIKSRKDGADLILNAAANNTKIAKDVLLQLADSRVGIDDEARFATAVQDGQRYFMVRYRPKLDFADRIVTTSGPLVKKHWLFLVETSGDRDPLLARAQIEVIRNLLGKIDRDDTFAVMTAATRIRFLNAKPQAATPENIKSAIDFLESAHLIGALDLGKALTEAQAVLKDNPGYIVHVGSGIPAMGERRQDVLIKHIPEGTRYVGVGVGKRWGRSFMKAAAEATAGHFTQINPDEAIAWRAFDLFATLQTPRLLNVQVAASTPMLVFAQSLSQGEEICALTRCEALPAEVTVRGIMDGKPFERLLPVKNVAEDAGYLPRMWAKLEIDRLLAQDAVKNKKPIVELSKGMYVMSPFTSLLVLENEDMYVQYKVDKGRKDHWAMYPCPNKIAVVYEPLDGSPDPKTLKAGQKLPAKTVLGTIAVRGAQMDSALQNWSAGLEYNVPLGYRLELSGRNRGFEDLDGSITGKSNGSLGSAHFLRHPATDFPPSLKGFVSGLTPAGTLKVQGMLPLALDPLGPLDSTDQRPLGLLGGRFPTKKSIYDASSGQRIQFAPVFVNPEMEWAIPKAPMDGTPMGIDWSDQPLAKVGQIIIAGSDISEDRIIRRMPPPSTFFGPGNGTNINLDVFGRPAREGNAGDKDRVFFDLVAYAPGMNTSQADIESVLDAESLSVRFAKKGKIDAGARDLLERARNQGWQTLTIPAAGKQPAFTITFDGSGRFAYERKVWPGITEKVTCDGKTLVHLYPELRIGARRTVSRGHRADFNGLVPWALPPAEDLARGADVKLIGERTVAVVPIGSQAHGWPCVSFGAGYSTLIYSRWIEVHMTFGADGRLAERHLVLMPKKEILYRLTCAPEGTVKLLDAKGKELSVRKMQLAAAEDAPTLAANTKDFVVLDLPYRTPEHVKKILKIENKQYNQLSFKEALPLFAAFVAAGNGNEANNVFRQVFHAKEQRQLGFYVLLAACGQNLDAQNGDVLAEHIDEPLAQYLALHSSPVLRKHASQWAVQSGLGEGFLRHLAVTHALLQRWQNERIVKIEPARLRAERQRALDYIKDNHDSAFGWALLALLQERAGKDNEFHKAIADSFKLFEKVPGLGYAARYEQARCLFKSGQVELARKQFQALYEDTFKKKMLPAIDGDFRQALQKHDELPDVWISHCRKIADRLIEAKRRPAVLALAWQTWQLGDQPLANHLLAIGLDKIADAKEKTGMTLAGIAFLQKTGQLARADQLLTELLQDPKMNKEPALWRLAAELAGKRDMTARQVECLEKALDREFKHLPEVIDLQSVRKDYSKLLDHYQGLADAMVALKLKPPAGFLTKVVKTADRWRALDREATSACQAAAAILRRFDERDLAWDYLTTPIGLSPNESAPWLELAGTMNRTGELDLADRAYLSAYETEPTNAQILWDRAQNLRQAGKTATAKTVLTQIVEGTWQPRFQSLQAQAKLQLQESQ